MRSAHAAGARPLNRLLVAFGIAAVGLAGVETAMIAAGPAEPTWAYASLPAVGLVYCLAGAYAWGRRPSSPIGTLLMLGGLAWFGAALVGAGAPALVAFGQVVTLLPVALTIHLLFAFPSGRVTARADRIAVAAGYVGALALAAPAYLFGDRGADPDALRIADVGWLAALGDYVPAAVGWAVSVAIALSLRRRLRAASPRQRRALGPFVVYGLLALAVIPLFANVLPALTVLDAQATLVLQRLALAGIPLAAVAAMLRGGFPRTAEIEEMLAWLGAGRSEGVGDVLAATVGDPSLELAFRLDDGRLVDERGEPARWPAAGSGRALETVAIDGLTVAAIGYDATAVGDGADVAAAARVLALWIERDRLTAALLAGDAELRRSRRRVIEAADGERRRIAQDLHDGHAARLVLLGMRVDRAARAGAVAGQAAELARVREELEAALRELRALVYGVMPPGLVERGLAAALDDLAARAPMAVRLEVAGLDGLAPEIERSAYFVVAEAVANAARHAGPCTLDVAVRRAGGRLEIEVADDGAGLAGTGLAGAGLAGAGSDGAGSARAGGADGGAAGGGLGLSGMGDRVAAYGGTLTVAPRPGGGTVVRAALPLAQELSAMNASGPFSAATGSIHMTSQR